MSSIEFTSIHGCGPFEPICYLLKIDEFELLLDCGWNAKFDVNDISNLNNININNIDGILLSKPDLLHLGGLPYIYGKLGFKSLIYSTSPVWRMGQYTLIDNYVSIHKNHMSFDLFDHNDISNIFKNYFKIKLKYMQQHVITKNDSSLVITPYSSGHMIGGTIWKIQKDNEIIIYGIDYNCRRERHLNECKFDKILINNKPTLFITDAYNISTKFTVKRDDRDKILTDMIMKALKRQGSVLIPCDTSGRTLELLLIIYQHFVKLKLFKMYDIMFLSYTAINTLNAAKSMLEWMSEWCQNELDERQKNIFDFDKLIICQSINEYRKKISNKPYICIASNEFLECGLSQKLFLELIHKPSNLLLIVNRVSPSTLAGKILQTIELNISSPVVSFDFIKKVKLNKDEMTKKRKELQKMNEEKNKQKEQKRQNLISFSEHGNNDVTMDDIIQDISEDKSDDNKDDNMDESKDDFDVNKMDIDIIYDPNKNRKRVGMTNSYNMFPFIEYHIEMTPYGEDIDLEFYRNDLDDNDDKNKSKEPSPTDIMQETLKMFPFLNENNNDSHLYKTKKVLKKVSILCEIKFINIEGRSDEDSVIQTLRKIKPKQIILVHSNKKNKDALIKYCKKQELCDQLFTPNNNEKVKLVLSNKYHEIIINDKFDKHLKFKNINDTYSVAFLYGNLKSINRENNNNNDNDVDMDMDMNDENNSENKDNNELDDSKPKKFELCKVNKIHNDYYDYISNNINNFKDNDGLLLRPLNFENNGHLLTCLGESKNIKMEQELRNLRIASAIYKGGVLVSGKNGEVRLKQNNTDNEQNIVNINATLTKDYFKIRDNLMSQFSLL